MTEERKQAIEAIYRIHNYCEEIDNHIPKEERTGYKMFPDVLLISNFLHLTVSNLAERDCLRNQVKNLTEENERLRADNTDCRLGFGLLEDAFKRLEKINEQIEAETRADTIRKMQTEIEARCLKGGIYPAFVKSTIDQIAKEMMEDENATN